MAMYQPGFPMGYQPYTPYQPYFQQQQQQQPAQQAPIQNGGFVSVRNIEEARNWPVAPGNSITFKDESAPYIYTKTMSYNQLDAPSFERYRLVKEEEQVFAPAPAGEAPEYATKAEFKAIAAEVQELKAQIGDLTPKRRARKEDGNESEDA